MMTATHDDEDGSGRKYRHYRGALPKRKAQEEEGSDSKDEKSMRRKKNREAAKRCRDKKLQQAEDLKQRNEELEKDNCELVKQRDELLRKCKMYEEELEQHKKQGCLIPSPPFDLNQILDITIPPSPVFSEFGRPGNSSPYHSPAFSPCPIPSLDVQLQQVHQDDSTDEYSQEGMPAPSFRHKDVMMNDVAESVKKHATWEANHSIAPAADVTVGTPEHTELNKAHQLEAKHCFLTVKDNDGKPRTLRLSQEDYKKVIQRINALQYAQQKQVRDHSQKRDYTGPLILPKHQDVLMPQTKRETTINFSINTSPAQDASFHAEASGQPHREEKVLDTMDDVISVVKGMVKNTSEGYVVDTSHADDQVKEESVDPVYLHTFTANDHHMIANVDGTSYANEVKQERAEIDKFVETDKEASFEEPKSTGWQIRSGMETLTNLFEPDMLEGEVEFLVDEEDNGMFTITVVDPKTAQVVEQTTASSGCLTPKPTDEPSVQMASLDSWQHVEKSTSNVHGGTSYKNTSLAATNRRLMTVKQQRAENVWNQQNIVGSQPMSISVPFPMPNIRLRPNAQQMIVQPPSQATESGITLHSLWTEKTEPGSHRQAPSSTVTWQTSAMQFGAQSQGDVLQSEVSAFSLL